MGYLLSTDPDSRQRIGGYSEQARNHWQEIAARGAETAAFHAGYDLFARHFSGPRHWQLIFEGYLDREHSQITLESLIGDAALPDEFQSRFERLAGAYSLVAWNTDSGEIIATRDRTGARTLFYAEHDGELTLATSSDWVVRASGIPRREEPRFIISMLSLQQAPPPGLSAFEGVRELMPGEILRFRSGRLSITRTHHDFAGLIEGGRKPRRADDWVDEFFHLFQNAVISCLPPEGDVACMLSGGLDSGPTAVLADEHLQTEGRALRPISWSLSDFPECDETRWIQQVASGLGHPVDARDLSDALPFSTLDSTVVIPDLPVFNAFRRLVNDCYERASAAGCQVILNASTGDQIYPQRRWVHLDRLRRRQGGLVWRDLSSTFRSAGLSGLLKDPALRHPAGRWLTPWRHRPKAPDWLAPEAKESWCPPPEWPQASKTTPEPDFTRQLFGAPMAFGVAHEAAMAQRNGVDRRDPFHNEALLTFMLKAPYELSWRGGFSKAIMRRAMRGRLPGSILEKERTGRLEPLFKAGVRARRKELEALLFDEQTAWQHYVTPAVVRDILERHRDHPGVLLATVVGHSLWRRHSAAVD